MDIFWSHIIMVCVINECMLWNSTLNGQLLEWAENVMASNASYKRGKLWIFSERFHWIHGAAVV